MQAHNRSPYSLPHAQKPFEKKKMGIRPSFLSHHYWQTRQSGTCKIRRSPVPRRPANLQGLR
jgi:hypothetical protein